MVASDFTTQKQRYVKMEHILSVFPPLQGSKDPNSEDQKQTTVHLITSRNGSIENISLLIPTYIKMVLFCFPSSYLLV